MRRIGATGEGADARYELVVRMPRNAGLYFVLERPACAGKRRVSTYMGGSAREMRVGVTPSFGDFKNARWCPGTYRGIVRLKGAREPRGTFSFRVR